MKTRHTGLLLALVLAGCADSPMEPALALTPTCATSYSTAAGDVGKCHLKMIPGTYRSEHKGDPIPFVEVDDDEGDGYRTFYYTNSRVVITQDQKITYALEGYWEHYPSCDTVKGEHLVYDAVPVNYSPQADGVYMDNGRGILGVWSYTNGRLQVRIDNGSIPPLHFRVSGG